MADLEPVLADLEAESGDLDLLVCELPAEAWATPTPSDGWTIAHQIAHLAWTDDVSVLAITDPAGFQDAVTRAFSHSARAVDDAAAERAAQPAADLLASWRAGRATLTAALTANPPDTKIAWFGPPMSATSMATARLMETWAHGQDVADALGVTRLPTVRLRHIAHLGVRTRNFAYAIRDRTPPAEPVRVELHAPDGTIWIWGPDDASQTITGSAVDFCLRVTQRRHRDDLSLVAIGPAAEEWLDIAQAFAGAPGPGRPPGRIKSAASPS